MSIFEGINKVGEQKSKKYRVFYCFDGEEDYWRVYKLTEKLTQMSGQKMFAPQEWQQILSRGEVAIKQWSDKNLQVASCLIVLIGAKTFKRSMALYQIKQAWERGKAIFGVYIHNCDDMRHKNSPKGQNPFDFVEVDGQPLSTRVQAYEPPFRNHDETVSYIQKYISGWVATAIAERDLKR